MPAVKDMEIHGATHMSEGSCDWKGCGDDGVHQVMLDDYIGPYDKAELCHAHRDEWRSGGADRQRHLKLDNFR